MLYYTCWSIILFVTSMNMASTNPTNIITITNELQDAPVEEYPFSFTPRLMWGARIPLNTTKLSHPIPYVVIHHSYIPGACENFSSCAKAMRSMQNYHMDDHGWWDIGYNFAVGGDGVVYEGRGWRNMGAHAKHFNAVSVGICLIGDWSDTLPPLKQLETAKSLILSGTEIGYINKNYKLVGHRQVRNTECPGQTLYDEIKKWQNYSPIPASVTDLVNVPELPEETKLLLINQTSVKSVTKSIQPL